MLVTFCTEAYADILMFGDIAVQLLKLISGALRAPLIGSELSYARRELQASRYALRLSTRSSGNRPNRLQALTRFPALDRFRSAPTR
jgi:hypothetical protein